MSAELDEQRKRYRQSSPVETNKLKCSGIMVLKVISFGDYTDLHVFYLVILTGMRNWEEIFDLYVCPYVGAIGNDFIQMDDNERPH